MMYMLQLERECYVINQYKENFYVKVYIYYNNKKEMRWEISIYLILSNSYLILNITLIITFMCICLVFITSTVKNKDNKEFSLLRK